MVELKLLTRTKATRGGELFHTGHEQKQRGGEASPTIE